MEPTNVKRYSLEWRYRGMESWQSLEEESDGDYVRAEDYDEMEARLRDLLEKPCKGCGA